MTILRKSSKGLIHAIAECMDCGWREERYRQAARDASRHVRETGHRVAVEQATAYVVSLVESEGEG